MFGLGGLGLAGALGIGQGLIGMFGQQRQAGQAAAAEPGRKEKGCSRGIPDTAAGLAHSQWLPTAAGLKPV